MSGSSAGASAAVSRRAYLDWLRGVAVLVMIEAHTVDAWTQPSDRSGPAFAWALIVGGFGAPVFLFLAGIALALAAGSRLRRGGSPREVAARARRRGWEIFALAFLFRLQSKVISGGGLNALLKVDILNIMGLSMLGAAVVWSRASRPWSRVAGLAGTAVVIAMLTPVLRASDLLAPLPDVIEAYLRPSPGRTTFTLLPWAAFLFAGAAIGVWLDAARTPEDEARANLQLALLGVVVAACGYAASFLPSIYPVSNFWTTSPTFFFLRLGVLIVALPLAYAWNAAFRGWSPVRELGLSSLFVYWIHVEMVYGVPSAALRRALSLEQVAVAALIFCVFLFLLVRLKERVVAAAGDWKPPRLRPLRSRGVS